MRRFYHAPGSLKSSSTSDKYHSRRQRRSLIASRRKTSVKSSKGPHGDVQGERYSHGLFVAVVLFLFVLTLDGKVSIALILASSIESERGAGCTERDEYTLINLIKPGPEHAFSQAASDDYLNKLLTLSGQLLRVGDTVSDPHL